ncbi:ABC-2 family transporter protein [Evansella caseinilytica]|uniref:ABC-2 family transporter protein n=1 Tax=Evansella caseinilytica TaxID=1503961 RepID=A0A1H3QA12_9BACI|nr:ABC transporter permease [Evansella caseinilytica]SDZ09918.1 ABC-2 family transporter protein [Evansella caseinilytica]
MFHLVGLEIKKFKLGGFIRNAFLANLILTALIIMIYFVEQTEPETIFSDYQQAFSFIDSFVRITFVVFASVLIAKMIIGEYKTKTISLMYTYPVNRKKMMAAKLFVVGSFTFSAVILANLFAGSVFVLVNSYYRYIPEPLTAELVFHSLLNITLGAAAAACISFVPLFFGMRKKSVPATIVSSLLLIGILSSNNNGFSLYSIIAIPLAVGVIGLVVAYFSIRNVEKEDIN